MEEKSFAIPLSDTQFLSLLSRAKKHDPEATLKIIQAFDSEIQRLAKYMRTDQEEAVQILIAELIAILQSN